MAEALSYDAFYMSGGNTSAHQLGWPDSGTSMRDMVDNARKILLTVDRRQPAAGVVVYEGLREDKPATEVRRPVPHPKPATADSTATRSRDRRG